VEREDVMRDEDKKIVAYHEAGHALIAHCLPEADPLNKMSIIPRGRALGATEQLPAEDRQNVSRRYLKDRIAIMLGGRVAEHIVFGDFTSGAANDLNQCTQLARRMVCHWGMSEKIGPVTYKQGEPHPFLGRELSHPKDFSEYTAKLIDDEVSKIILDMETNAGELLRQNREKLDALANALLENETMTKEEIEALFK
jgi:cell division protease FtsH